MCRFLFVLAVLGCVPTRTEVSGYDSKIALVLQGVSVSCYVMFIVY